jgi:gliding motility-associated-like protein
MAVFTGNGQIVCDKMYVKEYSASGHIEPFAIKYLLNEEILVAGKASSSSAGSHQLMAAKLSSSGDVLWSKLFGGLTDDKFTGIVLLNDNSYLLYGITTSNGHTEGKGLVTRLAADGSVIWSRVLGDASASRDRIKAITQSADGDIIGTFNVNDSSDLSDPVVFKMGLDGAIRWARRFDNSGDDSFTSLAEYNNQVFVGGFTNLNGKAAVLTILNSNDGIIISSQRPYHFDTSYDQELANLEVFDGRMSFALWSTKEISSTKLYRTLLIQSDLTGHTTFETKASIEGSPATEFLRRSKDDGFFLLSSSEQYGIAPVVIKVNRYNSIEWSAVQSDDRYWFQHHNYGFDITNTNGTVSAGYYQNYNTGYLNRMKLVRTGETGATGNCTVPGNIFFVDTVTLLRSPSPWSSDQRESIGLNQLMNLAESVYPMTKVDLCDSSYCTDITPLPPPCNKTMLVEYSGKGSSSFRDEVTTPDGGKIIVGDLDNNGLIAKLNNNGDISWSKKFDEFNHNMKFHRVIRSGPDQVLAFGNTYSVVNHGVSVSIKVVKLDLAGNVLLSKEISRYGTEIADVFAIPDGGFVATMNEAYGMGYTYSPVVRFDKDFNVVWKKEITHSSSPPVYRSLYCTDDAVYIGHDVYDQYNQDKVGVHKLDLATGINVWSKRYALDAEGLRFNRIFVLHDTVYAFVNRHTEVGYFDYDYRIAMLRLRTNGNIINSVLLNSDSLVLPYVFSNYLDYTSPTITFTPDSNFVMSHPVKTAGGRGLNITRFDKNGQGIWSKNYNDLDAYTVLNIHTQDSGLLIIGTVLKPNFLDARHTNSFLLKTDNRGDIIGTGAGMCKPQSTSFNTVSVAFQETASRIDGVIELRDLVISSSPVVAQSIPLDATLYCNQVAYCSSMELQGDANSCKMKDTLTFYITNNNCGALTKWTYDTAYFAFVSKKGDTLRLSALKSGASTVNAEIESPCSVVVKSLPVSVLVSAANLSLGKDTTICAGTTLSIAAGEGYQSYRWNDSSTKPTFEVAAPGIYSVTVTDHCGGTATDEIVVTSVTSAFKISGQTQKCNRDTLILSVSPGLKNYRWTPAGHLSFTDQTAKAYPLQTTKYFAEAETPSGCVVKDSFVVTVKTSPPIQLGNDIITCYNQPTQLSAPAGFSNYQWNNGSKSATITTLGEGTYFVRAEYGNGCVSADTVVVSNYPFLQPELGADTSICTGNDFSFDAGNYREYTWNDLSTSRFLSVSKPGKYWVNVTDANGCTGSDTIRILNVYQKPVNFLVDTLAICWGDSRQVSAQSGFNSYEWSIGSSSGTISITEIGSYYLTVKDKNGCTGKDTLHVSRKTDCPNTIYFYNAFTPNNDGRNDFYKPIVSGNVEKFLLTIYNRNGEIIFTSKDPRSGWNGLFKGIEQSSGAFIFNCNYKFYGMNEVRKSGTFILIR